MKTDTRHQGRIIWRGSPALVVVLALVCLSVFVWGLQYKLSLYKASERARPTIPAAKLLSPKQRLVVAARISQPLPRDGSLRPALPARMDLALLLGLTCTGMLANLRQQCSTRQTWRTAEIQSRPPPAAI